MSNNNEFAPMYGEGPDGEPRILKIRVRPADIHASKQYKVSNEDRNIIWSFCEDKQDLNAFVYMLRCAERRKREYTQTMSDNADKAARNTNDITVGTLEQWYTDYQQPKLF